MTGVSSDTIIAKPGWVQVGRTQCQKVHAEGAGAAQSQVWCQS